MDDSKQSLNRPRLLELLREMLALHEASIDCETCGEQIECLAELITVGQSLNPNDMLPAVQNHLDCCKDCREEFNALLVILRAEQSGELNS